MDSASTTVIVETPKESRIKYKLDHASGLFKVDRILAQGLRFPFNFGFFPDTRAADGDPTDVLVLLDEVLFPGCSLDCFLLGVIQAEQSEKGRTYRNDRILAISVKDVGAPKSVSELPKNFISDVERFFATYHQSEGNQFKVLRVGSQQEAFELLEATAVRVDKRKR